MSERKHGLFNLKEKRAKWANGRLDGWLNGRVTIFSLSSSITRPFIFLPYFVAFLVSFVCNEVKEESGSTKRKEKQEMKQENKEKENKERKEPNLMWENKEMKWIACFSLKFSGSFVLFPCLVLLHFSFLSRFHVIPLYFIAEEQENEGHKKKENLMSNGMS